MIFLSCFTASSGKLLSPTCGERDKKFPSGPVKVLLMSCQKAEIFFVFAEINQRKGQDSHVMCTFEGHTEHKWVE